MTFRNVSPGDVISGGARIVHAGWKGGEIVVTYGKPALVKSANLATQAASWGAQNPILATCAVVGTTGAVVLAAPASQQPQLYRVWDSQQAASRRVCATLQEK
ncbi:hypothetical protein NUH16_003465 [Penicillium rubens]|nr:hypothetical protein NUH16_003465 [Penicillium rubens]